MEAITIPAVRGVYNGKPHYSASMSLEEVLKRIQPADKENAKEEPTEAFSALTLAVGGGNPMWNDMRIEHHDVEYYTMGLLTLSGDERIRVVSGAHLIKEIEDVLKDNIQRKDERIPVVFISEYNS